ncbi:MAG: STAS domain-containing protein [Acidimicrobiia bacterium]
MAEHASSGQIGWIDMTSDPLTPSVIELIGDLDLTNADALRVSVDTALSSSTRLVFDMTQLTFMDSSGLAVLIDAALRAESVSLRSVPSLVSRVIELSGVGGVFRIEP